MTDTSAPCRKKQSQLVSVWYWRKSVARSIYWSGPLSLSSPSEMLLVCDALFVVYEIAPFLFRAVRNPLGCMRSIVLTRVGSHSVFIVQMTHIVESNVGPLSSVVLSPWELRCGSFPWILSICGYPLDVRSRHRDRTTHKRQIRCSLMHWVWQSQKWPLLICHTDYANHLQTIKLN